MKKLSAILLFSLMLTGCGTSQPVNPLKREQPILNIDVTIAPHIEVFVNEHSAWVKNTTQQPINLFYHLFWYDKNGLSQPNFTRQTTLSLAPQEKQYLELKKPSTESVNYRLYIH